MSEHPNVTVINRMTQAVFDNDREALAEIFTDDLTFHARGPVARPGDHQGVDGFLEAMRALFELTDGDVKVQQLFCIADGEWATEWERVRYGRHGKTMEANDIFVYEFRDGRIADLWMICAAPADQASFWD